VVCKQLGFPLGASKALCCSYFGFVPTSFSYSEVQCSGVSSLVYIYLNKNFMPGSLYHATRNRKVIFESQQQNFVSIGIGTRLYKPL
jgi:hypothetical protein